MQGGTLTTEPAMPPWQSAPNLRFARLGGQAREAGGQRQRISALALGGCMGMRPKLATVGLFSRSAKSW